MAEIHYFDVKIAEKYGINCAILLQNIWHWVRKNESNGENFYDGNYWTYNSARAFSKMFPYMSAKQINTALAKLRDEGIIETGNYNKVKYDRTLWYSVTEKGKSILLYGKIDFPCRENEFSPQGKPIPDINTYINTDISKKERIKERKQESTKSGYDEILATIADDNLRETYLDYIKMRKMIKAPMTDRALQMLINKVEQLEPGNTERQKLLLDTAILNNWKSVYPLKDNQTRSYGRTAEEKNDGYCINPNEDSLDDLFP